MPSRSVVSGAGRSGADDASPRRPFLLDVTLRDGGYVNDHSWTVRDAEAVVATMSAASVPCVEVGYLRADPDPARPAASCPPDYLRALTAVRGGTALGVMVRPGEVPVERLSTLPGLGVSLVRVLVGGRTTDRAAPYVRAARDAGLTVAMNLTRVSERSPGEVAEAVGECAAAGADLVYLADSNGSLFPPEVSARVAAAVGAGDVPVGFHPHDNLGLAFSNTQAALDAGAVAVDASLAGIGKGGGNLQLEVFVAYLIARCAAPLRFDPLIADRSALLARLRMLADGGSMAIVSGILDVNLDQAPAFRRKVAENGFDAILHGRAEVAAIGA